MSTGLLLTLLLVGNEIGPNSFRADAFAPVQIEQRIVLTDGRAIHSDPNLPRRRLALLELVPKPAH